MNVSPLKILLLLLFVSCKQTEFSITDLLSNYYANKKINNYVEKQRVINQLTGVVVSDDSVDEIRKILNHLNDGHVYIYKTGVELYPFRTDLIFYPGTQYVKSCLLSCLPALKGKFKIMSINNKSIDNYLKETQYDVFASTPHGKYHRAFQRLQVSRFPFDIHLTVKDIKGKVLEVAMKTNSNIQYFEKCVNGHRLSRDQYYISVNSLWCNNGGTITDIRKIYNKFYNDWTFVISQIKDNDRIVLDLRENNGGGDFEVMLVINTFIERKVLLYKYQFLKNTILNKKEKLLNILNFDTSAWARKEDEYVDKYYSPRKFLYKNKIITLISAGCFSSCEGLAGNLKVHSRSTLIGNKTHGGAGDPRQYLIKNTSYYISLPACITWLPDNSLIEGQGVSPDIRVDDQFKLNEDEVLNAALNI